MSNVLVTPANVGSITESQSSTENTQSEANEASGTEAVTSTGSAEINPVKAAAAEAKATEVAKSNKRKYKGKVDGQEFEEEIDFDNEEDIVKRLQLAKVAQKRMGEKSQLEKEVREFIEELRKNPKKVLSDPNIGVDLKEFAAAVLKEEIENSQKSPEVLEKEKAQAELRDLKAKNEKEAAEFKAKEFERLQEREFERYDNLMDKALSGTDLPKSPYVVKKMADYMLLGLQNNLDVSPEDVLPIVREEILADIKAMFDVMPEEVIEKFLGKDVLTKLRKKNISKAKNPATPLSKSITETGNKAKETEKAALSKMDYKKYFGI